KCGLPVYCTQFAYLPKEYVPQMLALRTYVNMFSMDQLREQATKYKLWTLKAVSSACLSEKPPVRLSLSQLLLKYTCSQGSILRLTCAAARLLYSDPSPKRTSRLC